MDSVEVKRGRGRPKGTPGHGKYGCTTKVVRVPVNVADNLPAILNSFEDIKRLVDEWDDRCEDSINRSGKGVISPRYEKAREMLAELRSYLGS